MGTYRVHKYSTLEDIEEDVKKMSWPLGVVVFGPDCRYMDEVVKKIQDKLKEEACYDRRHKLLLPNGSNLKKDFEAHNIVVLVLNASDSVSCKRRHKAFRRLQRAGAGDIVMVRVEPNSAMFGSEMNFSGIYKLYKQIGDIEKSMPHRYEGYYITLEEGRNHE